MKEYVLELPEKLKEEEKYIKEYLIIQQWKDHILSSGACAKMLGVEKFDFQDEILRRHGITFMG